MRLKFSLLIDLILKKQNKIAVKRQSLVYAEKYVALLAKKATQDEGVSSIVFSKDRAMQLHAFIASFEDNIINGGKMFVLYKASNERHKKSYGELIQIYGNRIDFIEENNFRTQLISLCETCKGNILLFVDDMIFTHRLDFKTLRNIDTSQYVVSLSRGSDLTYSLIMNKQLNVPDFHGKVETFNVFNWNESSGYSDWTWNGTAECNDWSFPLAVSGYMYGGNELVAMLKCLDFNNPNTLEAEMQWFLPFFMNRKGLCSDMATTICVPANLVQSDYNNATIGTFSVEELLVLWEEGKRIDVREFYNKPLYLSQEMKFKFIELGGR